MSTTTQPVIRAAVLNFHPRFQIRMENENIVQPLDTLMTKLGLTNAHLVNASTEQLSFKMLQKARKGRPLSPKIQMKILVALLAVKPDLNLRCRDLFRYELGEVVIEAIRNAIAQIREKKIKYPQFVELLTQAGITGYTVEVAINRVTFFGTAGEAHIEQGPAISQDATGQYNEADICSAILDAQKELIDHPAFLKRIHESGVVTYEVNCRSLKIEYKGQTQSIKEKILPPASHVENVTPVIEEKKAEKPPRKKVVRNKRKSLTRKARTSANKRFFKQRRNRNKVRGQGRVFL